MKVKDYMSMVKGQRSKTIVKGHRLNSKVKLKGQRSKVIMVEGQRVRCKRSKNIV